ncbi:hypothetical protein DL1_18490 [Thioclava dalianensis]|uniref:Phage protein n=1 Tax=Thioclava dalianensis TaxID=1185766 RepID=A0A074TCJ8_9RHOB|nr:hypothetical protein [Thioclava dalianensis]KEP67860.1 hypothetical protein DL1_18490 [Thioclava dalianensis]SFN95371.1 hypothetical protein SAMN05216224_1373 [Thioclava dalianensis]
MGMKETASRLIAKYGQAATLSRPGESTVDEFGNPVDGEPTLYPVTVVSATYAIELQLLASGWLETGDQRVFVSVDGLSVEPKTTDKLVIDGTEFETRRISPLAPAGEVIFWEMQVRKYV